MRKWKQGWLMFLLIMLGGASLLLPGQAWEAEAPVPLPRDHYQVAVLGGTPEGVAAAVAAAREGKRVLLVEPRERLGGVLVYGALNSLDLNRGPDGQMLNGGLFAEWYSRVEGDSFDVETAARAFADLVQREPNLTVWLRSSIGEAVVADRHITSVVVRREGQGKAVVADRYIDATEDADVAAGAGVAFTRGREDYLSDRTGQAATLVFRVTGVNWGRARQYLEEDGNPYTGSTHRSIWGYGERTRAYRPTTPRLALRGLNVGRQNDGSALINALWIFGVDPLSEASRREAIGLAKAELPRVVAYLQENCPGFEGAELAGTADELYIRESRHMAGALYQLTIDDVLENRDQPDAIGYGSYPVDIQAARPGERVTIVGVPRRYAIPLRSLIPRELDNLLVASRSAGYTSLAHGSARTVPVGMAAGQAAGVAAALSLDRQAALPALAADKPMIRQLQNRLVAQGVHLSPVVEPSPLQHSAYADDVRYFRRRGLIAAGYSNDYGLDRPVSPGEVHDFLQRAGAVFGVPVAPVTLSPDSWMTVERGLAVVYEAAAQHPARPVEEAMMAGALEPGIRPGQAFTRGMLYRAARKLLFVGEA